MLDVLIRKPEKESVSNSVINLGDRADKPIKSFMKSVSWRIVGTLDTMIISYFITGKLTVAFSIGSIEVLTKTILYYFHERLWAHIHKIKLKLSSKSNDKQYKIKGVGKSTLRRIS